MTAYVHVGQCGNQLGAAYWRLVGNEDDLDVTAPTTAKKTLKPRRPPPAPAAGSGGKLPASTQPPPLFFHHFYHRQSRKARCILVDTEPKVIRSIVGSDDSRGSSSRVFFQPAFVHFEQSGRGNSWAMGYNFQRFQRNVIPSKTETMQPSAATKHARHAAARARFTPLDDDKRELMELAMESLQKLVETTDCFQGTVLMHSLGGGTGSGLGCRLMELIRDTYPRSYLVAASVAPSWKCGDTPLQNYNSVFTLAHLQEHADCVIYKENDELLRTAGYWKTLQSQQQDQSQHPIEYQDSGGSQASQQHRISIDELNHLAAADLAGLLFPMTSQSRITSMSPVAKPFDFGRLLHDLCPIPSATFLDVRTGALRAKPPSKTNAKAAAADPLFHAGICSIPLLSRSGGSAGEVESIATKLFRQTAQSFPRSMYATLFSSTTLRGFPSPTDASSMKNMQMAADAAFPGVAWNPEYQSVISYSSSSPFLSNGGKASVTICANNGHVLTSAEQYLQRAQRQFQAGAYVHWYKQHGLEESHFHEAFEKCQRLTTEYKELLR